MSDLETQGKKPIQKATYLDEILDFSRKLEDLRTKSHESAQSLEEAQSALYDEHLGKYDDGNKITLE